MAETIKRITIALTQTDAQYIEYLMSICKESQSTVIKRAIQYFYTNTKNSNKEKEK